MGPMNLGTWLKKLTTGKVIFETHSPINGEIRVVEDLYGRRVVVGGLTQSGGQVKKIWKKATSQIRADDLKPRIGLILGLGAGTLARLISQQWPEVKITGLEIDPQMVAIGKKYFDLEGIPNLEIVIADAGEYLRGGQSAGNYDLIFVDLYLADQVPPQCETVEFLRHLETVLAPEGRVVFNRLYYREHQKAAKIFLDKLERIFLSIRKKKVGGNLLVFAQRKR